MPDKKSTAEETAQRVHPDDPGAQDAWLTEHHARMARFSANLRDSGTHPVTGHSFRSEGYTDEDHAAAAARFEDYLLGEANVYVAKTQKENP